MTSRACLSLLLQRLSGGLSSYHVIPPTKTRRGEVRIYFLWELVELEVLRTLWDESGNEVLVSHLHSPATLSFFLLVLASALALHSLLPSLRILKIQFSIFSIRYFIHLILLFICNSSLLCFSRSEKCGWASTMKLNVPVLDSNTLQSLIYLF